MHERTVSTIAELDDTDWFGNVGRVDSQNAIFLSSRGDAVLSCSNEEWDALTQEAANQYTSKLMQADAQQFKKWNVLVQEVKEATVPLVLKKTLAVVEANNLPKVFIDTVQWDILHLCMEAEYAEIIPPGFYASQAYWYTRGHFPCGWQGHFPKGKLVVF